MNYDEYRVLNIDKLIFVVCGKILLYKKQNLDISARHLGTTKQYTQSAILS